VTYLLHVAVLAGIFAILAISLDLVAGYLGLFSLTHAGFFGIGAYAVAILTTRSGWPFLGAAAAGIVLAAVLGLVVGWPALRTRDDYFMIVTFALQVIAFSVMNNWLDMTGGPLGVAGVPRPVFFGVAINSEMAFFILTAIVLGVVCLLSWGLTRSPFGRVLQLIRADERLALATGRSPSRFKLVTFVISAALGSVGGAIFAAYIGFVDPSSFTVMVSVMIICMVVIGGAGTVWGALVGAVFLVGMPEALRFVGLPAPVAANLRQVLYGTLLMLLMVLRPQGFLGRYGLGKKVQ